MTITDSKEYEELTINSVAGLQAFLRNAQAQYNVGLSKEDELISNTNRSESDELHHAFQTVRHTTNKLIAKTQHNETITQPDAIKLQEDYDELVRIVLKLKNEVETAKSKPAEAEEKVEKKLVIKETETKKPNETETVVSKQIPDKKPAPPASKKATSLKPKTGSLRVASDDGGVIDVKNRMTANKSSDKAKSTKDKSKIEKNHDQLTRQKIEVVIKQSQANYRNLQQKYPKPNLVQKLLFEEVREGIEHLELIAKRAGTDAPIEAISEVASHIKYALEGIKETAPEVDKPLASNRVPISTRFTSQISNSKKPSQKENKTNLSFVPSSVTVKKPSVAKRTIPRELQTLPKPADIYKEKSLTEMYLTAPRHQQHINEHYSSPASFEQLLDANITKIEAETIDSIERWLGDLPASAFSFLEDMTIEELIQFASRKHEVVSYDLRQQNIKYETFAIWRDMTNEMLELVENGEKMKFGELFAHWMIELDIEMSQ